MTLVVKCDTKVCEGETKDFQRLYGHFRGKSILDVGCDSGFTEDDQVARVLGEIRWLLRERAARTVNEIAFNGKRPVLPRELVLRR